MAVGLARRGAARRTGRRAARRGQRGQELRLVLLFRLLAGAGRLAASVEVGACAGAEQGRLFQGASRSRGRRARGWARRGPGGGRKKKKVGLCAPDCGARTRDGRDNIPKSLKLKIRVLLVGSVT